jgi:hypothetical protein
MIQYLLDEMHLIISTHVDPPLPLAHWRVRNWLREFRAAELSNLTGFGARLAAELIIASNDQRHRVLVSINFIGFLLKNERKSFTHNLNDCFLMKISI